MRQVEVVGAYRGIRRESQGPHPAYPEGPLSGCGLGHEVPRVVLHDEPERIHGARRGTPVPSPVVHLDPDSLNDGALQRVEVVRRSRHAVVPSGRVEHDRAGRCFGVVAEGRRQGLHELAQRGPDFGCGAGRSGDQEERPRLVGGQAAEVRPRPADQLPASTSPGL